MNWIAQNLWLVPAVPAFAAASTAVAKRHMRTYAASMAIASLTISLLLSLCAFGRVLRLVERGEETRQICNFQWFQIGANWVKLGWVLDPLTAVMLVMVTFVGLLIFVYSYGYMARDENFTRFFCFLSLFAGGMLTVVIANSLLLLFMGWELVGLTSYLLIGFWYRKPAAGAAARKAFITTRIGDLAFLLGIVWLSSRAGTLLFYDGGFGCLEHGALQSLASHRASIGMAASTGIALLIFCGAAGKSGQVPLHVWLPDAMEGPTPVSALIHAATMVAAGVFLVARVYPLMAVHPGRGSIAVFFATTTALKVVTWVGAVTAIFAASIAVAQNDIKRILAYSTVSQLGYMMMGLGVGGVAIGMFHLVTHAFFKALLFLGAGSVIHGCHEEQDIRYMGGLRTRMPVTFATYAIGMLALSGFPLFFSGFWSKDEILHASSLWSVSRAPFYLGLAGALLTAFYMTRQVCYVFFGKPRSASFGAEALGATVQRSEEHPHESPAAMTIPLVVLAAAVVLLSVVGTPAWPSLQAFLEGERTTLSFSRLLQDGMLPLMLASSLIVFLGFALGWWLYGRKSHHAARYDSLESMPARLFALLQNGLYVDTFYRATFIRWNAWCAAVCAWCDRWVWNGAVQMVSYATRGLARFNGLIDDRIVNAGFDDGCRAASGSGSMLSRMQNGQAQTYLRLAGGGLIVLILFLLWSG